MKKIICFLGMLSVLFLSGCHHVRCEEKPVNVLAATFPVWLFTANICHDVEGLHVELLIPASAGCPHDFALRPADMQKLAQAKILVINGAGLESFLTKPLSSLKPAPQIIDATNGLAILEDHHNGYNPHLFSAPGGASQMVQNIAKHLAQTFPDKASRINSNAARYIHILDNISNNLKAIGHKAQNKNIAIEHDALAYLVINAGLRIVTEIEPSASAAELARIRKLLAQDKPALLAGDAQYNDRMLKNLAAELQLPFATLNPCASGPDDAPLDYYQTIMEENLKILEHYFE